MQINKNKIENNKNNNQTKNINDRNRQDITKQLPEAIKVGLNNKDFHVKRDYKLTQKIKFEHFYEYLSSEL